MSLTLHYDFATDKSLTARVGPTLSITRATDATYVDSSGNIATASSGVARFTHDKDGNSLGLLVEEARTNICLQSENLATSWTNTRSVDSQGETVAPDGSLTGNKLVDDSSTGTDSVFIDQSVTTATSAAYTLSVFLKADQLDWARISIEGSGAQTIRNFYDLANGALGSTPSADVDDRGIEDYGNGWYRCWLAFTSDSSDTSCNIRINVAEADNDNIVDLDGSSSIFVWGTQLEAGAFPTSYIPTTTASVTRNADVIGSNDVSWYDAENITWYCDYLLNGYEPTDSVFPFTIGSNSANYSGLGVQNPGTGVNAVHNTGTGNDGVVSSGAVLTVGTRTRNALAVASNDMAFYVDGSLIGTDSTVTVPASTAFDEFALDANPVTTGRQINGLIKEIRYYNERLDNSTLENISLGIFPDAGSPYYAAVGRASLSRNPPRREKLSPPTRGGLRYLK